MAFPSLQCILFFFCIMNLNSMFEAHEDYTSILSLKSITSRISKMFLRIPDGDFSGAKQKNKLMKVIDDFVNSMFLFYESSTKLNYLRKLVVRYPAENKNWVIGESKVFDLMKTIDEEYNRFKMTLEILKKRNELMVKPKKYPKIMETCKALHNSLISGQSKNYRGFLPEIITNLKQRQQIDNCENNHIPPLQYVFYDLYFTFVSSVLKAFAIDVLDHQYRYFLDRNITFMQLNHHIEEESETVNKMIEESHSFMSDHVGFANREYINCLLSKPSRDENFFELERVFQLIMISEDARQKMGKSTCLGSCSNTNGSMFGENFCTGDSCVTCEGVIQDCQSISSHPVQICVSNSNSSRRYQWIQQQDQGLIAEYGRRVYPEMCFNHNEYVYPEPLSLGICEHCLCTCEENLHYSSKSTFIISSQIANADMKGRMVVTGVRFVKHDRIIYTQIKQAKLIPGGWIDEDTNDWKPIEKLKRNEVNSQIKNKNPSSNNNFIVIRKDVRTVNLNDVFCPSEKHVVTGVGLGMSKTEVDINRITLFINCHPVSFKEPDFLSSNRTGPIENTKSETIRIQNGKIPLDRVIDGKEKYFSNGYHVTFNMSDWTEDAGQSVFPWFDARSVAPAPGTPLAGIGLNLRGGGNSGGLLGYKLHSIRYSNFM